MKRHPKKLPSLPVKALRIVRAGATHESDVTFAQEMAYLKNDSYLK